MLPLPWSVEHVAQALPWVARLDQYETWPSLLLWCPVPFQRQIYVCPELVDSSQLMR